MEVLTNMKLVANEISVKNNRLPGGTFNLLPQIQRKIGRVDETHMSVELQIVISNTEENPFPVDIRASMTGIFDMSKIAEKDRDSFLKIQSVSLILPHLRSMIASTTAAALMTPLMLPIYDARMLFPEEE